MSLIESYTSTGSKIFAHQEAMENLARGRGQPITTHVMPTDICNHTCAFCSVQSRPGDTLPLSSIHGYLKILLPLKLRSVIVSGGGNPLLYRCPETGQGFNNLIALIHSLGLEIGLITNGMPLASYSGGRRSWKTATPETLDRLAWVRISMSGLDHEESQVFIPDIDPTKTTLGFSYIFHDIYQAANSPHGKVSRPADLVSLEPPVRWAKNRIAELTDKIRQYVQNYHPRYVRLLPNCLEPEQIPERCEILQGMAKAIDPNVVFVQDKPPAAPNVCYLGYVHPVLNSDGYVYPCDSCVLNEKAGQRFGASWRICHWSEVGAIYNKPVHSLVNAKALCPGCVFTRSNLILEQVRLGRLKPKPIPPPEHSNFI